MKKIERKKFFGYVGKGFTGLIIMKTFPFNLLEESNKTSRGIKIKINSLAVSRNKDAKKNG